MSDNFYSDLGVAPSATAKEIKRRYRYLAHAFHPDKFPGEAQRQDAEHDFKRINKAYQVLSDPARRARFDARRSRNSSPPPNQDSPRTPQAEYQQPPSPSPRPSQPRATASPSPPAPTTSHGGLSRGVYVCWFVAIATVSSVFHVNGVGCLGSLVALSFFVPVVLRLRDIGASGLWLLVGLVPVLNYIFVCFLLCAPSGYALHRRADRTMKIFSAVLSVLSVIGLLTLFGYLTI